MVTKKARKEFLETVFMGFEGMFRTDGFFFEISVWEGMYKENYIVELSRLLVFIANSPYLENSYDIWRNVGYYDCTDDIYMQFAVNIEKVKEAILEDRKNA